MLPRRFHSRSRLGAALHLGFVRMTGRTLGAFDYVPRTVLDHGGHQLGCRRRSWPYERRTGGRRPCFASARRPSTPGFVDMMRATNA
jgi:hypothetical protein